MAQVTNTDPRRKLGTAGEEMAAQKLLESGFTIVARNWRCAAGELDLVVQENAPDYVRGGVVPWLVFVEVRTRRGTEYGTALQSVTSRKQQKLRELAQHYRQQTEWQGPWRIDVVAVQMDRAGRLQAVEHIRHAVGG